MQDLRNCFTATVSLYCDYDDEDCVITDINITGGYWMIGSDPANNLGGVKTVDPAGGLWPHQIRSWEYLNFTSGGFVSDPQLTVTGNNNINNMQRCSSEEQ